MEEWKIVKARNCIGGSLALNLWYNTFKKLSHIIVKFYFSFYFRFLIVIIIAAAAVAAA